MPFGYILKPVQDRDLNVSLEMALYVPTALSPVSINTWIELAHPDDLIMSQELLKKHFKGELEYYEIESRIRHKNGNWIWVLDRGKVVTWTDEGKPLLMSGTHQEITDRKIAEAENERLIVELKKALAEVKNLSGMLPVCASCKKIRDDKGYWNQIESYLESHSEVLFSHGICPECAEQLYGNEEWYRKKKSNK